MKIAVTGAAGFLGLHLANRFSNERNILSLCDIQKFEKNEYPKSKFIKADIRNTSAMNAFTKNQDIVIHAAAALPLLRKQNINNIK